MLVTGARLVPVGGVPAPEGEVCIRILDGVVREVAPRLRPNAGEQLVEAGGRFAIPGLWDQHVHPVMWALARGRIDLAGTTSPEDALGRVVAALAERPGDGLVMGYGHRTAAWARVPSVAELDAVTGDRPVALTSGDGHNGWLNSAALRLAGVEGAAGPLDEGDWYPVYSRLEHLTGPEEDETTALREALDAASARGVVGLVDLEFGGSFRTWEERWNAGLDRLRIRTSTYEAGLEEVARRGHRTGEPLFAGQGLVTMGPFKVISDGSLNTMTAWCCDPYLADAELEFPAGRSNADLEVLLRHLVRAREIGLDAAVHAIGDRALSVALDAFEATGQRGSIEHAQLVALEDLPRMARLPVTASVQPAHLLDDRDVTERLWADRTDRVFAFRAMVEAGIPLALGSDAPVSPLDPWLAMAAAVHRSADDREPWHPEQALTAAEALAASTDGATTIAPGARGDLVLLDADPLAAQPDSRATGDHLRGMRVAATVVAGRQTYEGR
jgi:predicted amidohydrolase YtcJ